MNKTIFNLNYNISIIIMGIIGVVFAFLSNAFYVDGIIELLCYIFRFMLFIGIFLLIYLVEKNHIEFKETNKRMMGYLTISSLCNVLFSIFVTSHLLRGMFLTLSGIVCFWLILAFVIEVVSLYTDSNLVKKIFNFNKKIGLAFANPIVKFVDSKITND